MIKTFWKKTGSVQKAFTLVELLIAMSIFVVFLTIAGNSFLSIVRAQTAANQVREMYTELRGVIDQLNEDVRGGTIEIPSTEGTLSILAKGGQQKVKYTFVDDSLKRSLETKNGDKFTEKASVELFKNLQVNDVKFEIYPKVAPLSTNLSSLLQPMVFVDLQVESKNPNVKFDLNYHTLITARQI